MTGLDMNGNVLRVGDTVTFPWAGGFEPGVIIDIVERDNGDPDGYLTIEINSSSRGKDEVWSFGEEVEWKSSPKSNTKCTGSAQIKEVRSSDAFFKASVQEKACKQCSRKNDVGIHKCWFCETTNP